MNNNFLTYGSSAKNLYLLLLEDLIIMKEFYTRSITAIAYATVILLPLFYSEYLFYTSRIYM